MIWQGRLGGRNGTAGHMSSTVRGRDTVLLFAFSPGPQPRGCCNCPNLDNPPTGRHRGKVSSHRCVWRLDSYLTPVSSQVDDIKHYRKLLKISMTQFPISVSLCLSCEGT